MVLPTSCLRKVGLLAGICRIESQSPCYSLGGGGGVVVTNDYISTTQKYIIIFFKNIFSKTAFAVCLLKKIMFTILFNFS